MPSRRVLSLTARLAAAKAGRWERLFQGRTWEVPPGAKGGRSLRAIPAGSGELRASEPPVSLFFWFLSLCGGWMRAYGCSLYVADCLTLLGGLAIVVRSRKQRTLPMPWSNNALLVLQISPLNCCFGETTKQGEGSFHSMAGMEQSCPPSFPPAAGSVRRAGGSAASCRRGKRG